jgi:Protein of unknown function (DUF2891)
MVPSATFTIVESRKTIDEPRIVASRAEARAGSSGHPTRPYHPPMEPLTAHLGAAMARLAVENVGREYPNAPHHTLTGPDDLRPPRDLHPAFFGSYDWHSCVHQHWLIVRLLRLERAGPWTDASRAALDTTLTPANLEVEAAYLREWPTFERTYGWAWLLALADELAAGVDPDAIRWAAALEPAVAAVRAHWMAFLPLATYPIRAGTHANSAFGLALALDHARATGDEPFEAALMERALVWFGPDRDHPAHLEPGGDDFLSPALVEAVLMRRVLGDQFAGWFGAFLPDPPRGLLEPVMVADRSDAKTVHLDGLNLSRAWCWRSIGSVSPFADAAAQIHLDAALPHLFGGEYVGEHWVSSFALLALTG